MIDDGIEELVAQQLAAYQEELDAGASFSVDAVRSLDWPEVARQRVSVGRRCLELLKRLKTSTPGARERSPFSPSLPSKIGRFEVRMQLGVGGFGIVYLAFDPHTRREIALKIPKPEVLASSELIARFIQEARAAAKLDHPNLVAVLECDTTSVTPYIASIYQSGPTLSHWLKTQSEAVDPRVAAEIVQQLAEAVAHAHDRGVLHRDIKPRNVILAMHPIRKGSTLPFVPKLMDFGMAKFDEATADMTRTGALIGTIRYMAPEQAEGRIKDVTALTDVYALGVVLYEALTGTVPFSSETDVSTIRQIVDGDLTPVRSTRPDVSRDLAIICEKCLRKEPASRYPSARALAEDLDRYLHGQPIAARALTSLERFWAFMCRHSAVAATGLTAILFLAAGLLAYGVMLRHTVELQRDANWELNQSNIALQAANATAERSAQLARESERRAREAAYLTDIQTAAKAIDAADVSKAIEILRRHVPEFESAIDVRGLEWFLQMRRCRGMGRDVQISDKPLHDIKLSPDGNNAAVASEDGMIRVLSTHDWQSKPPIITDHGEVNKLAFSPAGDALASTGRDGSVQVWNPATGQRILTIPHAHEEESRVVVYTKDGSQLITGGADRTIRFWNARTGTPEGSLNGHQMGITALALSPDGRLLASGSSDKTARLWNIEAMSLEGTFTSVSRVAAVTFSSDGRLVLGNANGIIEQVNLNNSQTVTIGEDGDRGAFALEFLDGGPRLISASNQGTVRLWQTLDETSERPKMDNKSFRKLAQVPFAKSIDRCVQSWKAHDGRATAVAMLDRNRAASVGFDGVLHIQDAALPTLKEQARYPIVREGGQFSDIRCIYCPNAQTEFGDLNAFSFWPNGELLVVSNESGYKAYANSIGSDRPELLSIPAGASSCCPLTDATGQFVLVGYDDGRVTIHPKDKPSEFETWNTGIGDAITAIESTYDGRYVVLLINRTTAREIHAFEWPTRKKLFSGQPVLRGNTNVRLASGSNVLVFSAAGMDAVVICDLQTEVLRRFVLPSGIDQLAVRSDGAVVAVVERDGVSLLDAKNGDVVGRLAHHSLRIRTLDLSPDGRLLVTADSDGVYKLWHIPSQQFLCDLAEWKGCKPSDVRFDRNGRRLAMANQESTVSVIDFDELRAGR